MAKNRFLKINYFDNDLQTAMEMIAPAIEANLVFFNEEHIFKDPTEFYNGIRNLFLVQLNMFAAIDKVAYDYTEEVNKIEFSLVTYDAIDWNNNWETIYFQLFKDYHNNYGSYFFC